MQVDPRIIAAVAFLSIAGTGAILGGAFMLMMIGEINRKRPDGAPESYLWLTLPKLLRILREYRISYPHGWLHVWCVAAFIVVVICMVGVVVSLGIIG